MIRSLTESNNERKYLSDILFDNEISADLLVSILDNYFSDAEVRELTNYVNQELGIETGEELTEDLDADKLLSEISDNELKSIIKANGINISGSENKDQLTGMVKALAAKDESIKSHIKAEATKLKRKKGIGKKLSKFMQ